MKRNWSKIVGLMVLLMAFTTNVWAQPEGDHQSKRDRIEAMKVEFITSKLNLTIAEAQAFWPVYNEFTAKLRELEMKRRDAMREAKGKELSDAEINRLIQLNFDTDQEILDLRREYDAKFKEVLPVQKVGKLYLAEEQFKREILRRMKGGGGPPPGR